MSKFKKWPGSRADLHEPVGLGEAVAHVVECYDEIDRLKAVMGDVYHEAYEAGASVARRERDRLREVLEDIYSEKDRPLNPDYQFNRCLVLAKSALAYKPS